MGMVYDSDEWEMVVFINAKEHCRIPGCEHVSDMWPKVRMNSTLIYKLVEVLGFFLMNKYA
jgi:hypothetical protein